MTRTEKKRGRESRVKEERQRVHEREKERESKRERERETECERERAHTNCTSEPRASDMKCLLPMLASI
jgi:hypothetical protein